MHDRGKTLSPFATSSILFAAGWLIGLIGDSGAMLSGTALYVRFGTPKIAWSAAWFPFLVGFAVVGVGALGARLGLPSQPRDRRAAAYASAAVLALYLLTATWRSFPPAFACAMTAACSVWLWRMWDPSWKAFAVGIGCAVVGTACEIALSVLDLVHYAGDSATLFGVAAWLPCLYFGAATVASGMWRAIERPAE